VIQAQRGDRRDLAAFLLPAWSSKMGGAARARAWASTALLVALVGGGAAAATLATAQDASPGRQVFTSEATPPCALCHTLADAGAEGEIGPNLDEMKPTEDKVQRAVERGVGNMPPYGEILSDEQIAAVARYVAEASRR
jgi:mono/diheme cytochrome c family protein